MAYMNAISRIVPYAASPAARKVSFCVQLHMRTVAATQYTISMPVPMVSDSPDRLMAFRTGACTASSRRQTVRMQLPQRYTSRHARS